MSIDAQLVQAGAALRDARLALNEATAQARKTAVAARKSGLTEQRVADALGVSRMTVRNWTGK